MQPRYVAIAAAIVLAALAFLAYRPADDPRVPADRPRPTDRIVELQAPAEEGIATVELAPAPRGGDAPGGTAADTALIRRFEAESVDPAWAPIARERITSIIGPELERTGGSIEAVECRQTVCRVRLRFTDPTRRPEAVQAVTDAFARRGHLALLDRVQDRQVSLLVEP